MSTSTRPFVLVSAGGLIGETNVAEIKPFVGRAVDACSALTNAAKDGISRLLEALLDPARNTAMERVTLENATTDGGSLEVIALEGILLRKRTVDLGSLLEQVLNVFAKQTDVLDVSLTVDGPQSLPDDIRLDPDKIAWAISTLVGNALRHVRRGSRHRPGGHIAVSVDVDDTSVAVSVRDDGPGIPAEKRPYLFEPPPDAPVALGYALSLVREVVTAHGGSLQLESSTEPPETGTCVTLRVPRG